MRPYRLIFYFFKCYLDRVQYPPMYIHMTLKALDFQQGYFIRI